MKKYWYVKYNKFGLDLTLGSIGWRVYRFASKRERDNWLCDNDYNGCNHVAAFCKAADVPQFLGYVSAKIEWVTEGDSNEYERGYKVW